MAPPEPVALNAPGGPRLAALAWAAPPGAPGVVIVPGLSSRKENHRDFGDALAAAGIAPWP
jgi:dienelactone hydrolase